MIDIIQAYLQACLVNDWSRTENKIFLSITMTNSNLIGGGPYWHARQNIKDGTSGNNPHYICTAPELYQKIYYLLIACLCCV